MVVILVTVQYQGGHKKTRHVSNTAGLKPLSDLAELF